MSCDSVCNNLFGFFCIWNKMPNIFQSIVIVLSILICIFSVWIKNNLSDSQRSIVLRMGGFLIQKPI